MTMIPAPAVQPIIDSPAGHGQRSALEQSVRAEADSSATARLLVWEVAYRMFIDHPLGAGAANFRPMVASYDPSAARRDAHNTYLRCAAELGIPGITILASLVLNAYLYLHRARRLAGTCPAADEVHWRAYALGVSLFIMLICGLFMSQTYVEEFWWFLALPVCLVRAAENAMSEAATAAALRRVPTPPRRRLDRRHPASPIPGLEPARTAIGLRGHR